MVKMPKQVMDLFNDQSAIKFLSTVDPEGIPNVALIASLTTADEETLAFADVMMNKTKKNLTLSKNVPKKVAAVVYKPLMAQYQVKGTFLGFQTSGPLLDAYKKSELDVLRQASSILSVGTIKVEEVYLSQPPLPGKRIA